MSPAQLAQHAEVVSGLLDGTIPPVPHIEMKMGYVFTQPIIFLVGRRGVEPRTYGLRVPAVIRGCC